MALWIAASARRTAWAEACSFRAIWFSVEEIVMKVVPARSSTAMTNMTVTRAAPRGVLVGRRAVVVRGRLEQARYLAPSDECSVLPSCHIISNGRGRRPMG